MFLAEELQPKKIAFDEDAKNEGLDILLNKSQFFSLKIANTKQVVLLPKSKLKIN